MIASSVISLSKEEVQSVVQQYLFGPPAINILGLNAAVTIHWKSCGWLEITRCCEVSKQVPPFHARLFNTSKVNISIVLVFFYKEIFVISCTCYILWFH
jgi:hypothetical protein